MRKRLIIWLAVGLAIAVGIWGAGELVHRSSIGAAPGDGAERRAQRLADEIAAHMREDDRPPDPWDSPPAWWKKTTLDAFDQATAGKSWPSARRAVVAFAKESSKDPGSTGDEFDDALAAALTAIEYNCDDPLILYIRGFYERQSQRRPTVESSKLLAQAADLFPASGYPTIRKCLGLLVAAEAQCHFANDAGLPKARKYADAAVALLEEVFADPELPLEEALRVIELTSRASQEIYKDRTILTEPALIALEQSIQPSSVKLTARGDYLIKRAWDARGGGYADTVTGEGWAGFHERLSKARAALVEAFELDSSNGAAARLMITVCMGEGAPKSEMNRWFDRAIKINPGDYSACDRKLYYLEPKWHGSAAEMIQAAREMARNATDPRALQIPLIVPDAHWRLAAPMVIGTPPRADYFQNNSQAWDEIAAVYEAFLKKVPNSRYHRTRYAVLAYSAGHPEVAQAQFEIMGDDYSRAVLMNLAMESLRANLSRPASKSSTTKPAGD